MRDDAGTQDFSFRNLDSFEEVILVLVAGIGLEAERAGVDLQHILDDVGQGGLVKARTFVDAVAGVETHPLGRDAVERRVGSLDIDFGAPPFLGIRQSRLEENIREGRRPG
jgi:hypothetical protein